MTCTLISRYWKMVLALSLIVGATVWSSAFAQTPPSVELNVVVSDWTLPAFRDYVKEVYEAENPHVTLNWQGMAFRPLFESIEIQIGAQSPTIDVYGVDVPMVASYGLRGYLEPLDDYFSDEEISRWMTEAVEASMYEGRLIAAPGRTSTQMLYYNRDLFEAAGLTPPGLDPSERWTWEQVVEAAQALTADTNGDGATDVWGLLFHQMSRPYQMLALPVSAGGGTGISDDGLNVRGLLTNDGWLRAAQLYYDLHNTYMVSPKGVGASESQDYFLAGRVAMIVTGDWGLATFRDAPFEWGIAPHPYFAGGTPATPTGSWHWGISPYSQQKEEAAKLIRFITLDERVLTFLFEETARLPAHTILYEFTAEQVSNARLPVEGYELIRYELANTAVARPLSPGYLEWEDVVASAFEDVRNGVDPATAFQQAEGRIQGQLLKYGR